MPDKVVMASGNKGKIREITCLFEALGVEVVAQSVFGVDDAEETGTTFIENSLIKSRHVAAITGLPSIADDSGLVVDALEGAPGVYSARYYGPGATDDKNIDKLLDALQNVETENRGAAFCCAATFVMPGDPQAMIAEGKWQGSILTARQGDGGFGYDPVFLDPQSGASAAMLLAEEKNARSHRGQALRKLVAMIELRFA